MAAHRLMQLLLQADGVTDDEITELYQDLKYIYDNPFDVKIEEAIAHGATYVEVSNQILS